MYKFSSTFDTTPYRPSNCSDKEQDEKVLDKITHCYLPVSKWQLPKKITNSPNTAFCIHLHSFDKRGHLVSLRVRPAALTQQNRCLSNRGKHFRRCCPPVLKSGAGLFFLFSSRQVAQLNLTAERHTKLCPTRDGMWGQLPPVQNADRKNAVNPTFSHWQHEQLTNAFLSPIHCISARKLSLFFFFLNQTILQLDHFFHHFHAAHFSKPVPAQLKCHFSSLHCCCSKIQPCQAPVLEVRAPKASLLSPANFTQPPREKPKTSKDHTNEIYDKLPWKLSHLLKLKSLHFLQVLWKLPRKKDNSSSKSSFLLTVHMATNPASSHFLQT